MYGFPLPQKYLQQVCSGIWGHAAGFPLATKKVIWGHIARKIQNTKISLSCFLRDMGTDCRVALATGNLPLSSSFQHSRLSSPHFPNNFNFHFPCETFTFPVKVKVLQQQNLPLSSSFQHISTQPVFPLHIFLIISTFTFPVKLSFFM